MTSAPAPGAQPGRKGALLRVGVAACVFHADPTRRVFNGKPLYYIERSMARWVASQGALTYMIPEPGSADEAARFADDVDGLVLAGGVDVSPGSYGESPRMPEWSGDALRDAYEISLVRELIARQKPVLGICRGHQVLNVALGGTLHQDISTDVAGARVHRDPVPYDQLFHEIDIEPGSSLAALYGGITRATVNSVHHQAIKALGQSVVVEARSQEDGVVEAIRVEGPSYVRGVQWHPEFMAAQQGGELTPPAPAGLLDNAPILREFLEAAALRRQAPRR